MGVTSITYEREGSTLRVQVDGIPAEICPVCGEVYLSEAVAQQIYELVSPLLSAGIEMTRNPVLPIPIITIQFPPLEPAELEHAFAIA